MSSDDELIEAVMSVELLRDIERRGIMLALTKQTDVSIRSMKKNAVISDFEPGEVVHICGATVAIIRHGDSGTTVRPATRVTRSVKDKVTGEEKARFTAPSKAYTISTQTPVYSKPQK